MSKQKVQLLEIKECDYCSKVIDQTVFMMAMDIRYTVG